MTILFAVLAASLAVVCAWGAVAPRGQWRVLSSWTTSDPHLDEPDRVSYAVRRAVWTLGLAATLAVAGVNAVAWIRALPSAPAPLSAVEAMWGRPDPDILNRVVEPRADPVEGLTPVAILGYQRTDAEEGPPLYLSSLDRFTRVDFDEIPGLIGRDPDQGFSALDTADLVVHVRGDLACVPRAATLVETDTTVQIGIYYDRPLRPGEAAPPEGEACSLAPAISISLLIPIELASPLGDRVVQSLDGTPITEVRAPIDAR